MCGIVGIISESEGVSQQLFLALYALQHRGQESAGMSVVDSEGKLNFHKGMGLVNQVFSEKILTALPGSIGVGQTRYSTTGTSNIVNAQPFIIDLGEGFVSIVHNGNLVNIKQLRDELEVEGFKFEASSDTELIGVLLKKHYKGDIEQAVIEVARKIKGAFSVIFMTADKMIAITDPNGFKPLCIGKQGSDSYALSSESGALDTIGYELLRDVQKGEMVTIDNGGIKSFIYDNSSRDALCIFEFVYFARPDAIIHNRSVYEVRVRMGEILAREHPIEADMVVSIPDSGNPAAIGYSRESGIPYGTALIKNRYVGRTFINPDDYIRKLGVRIKLNPIKRILQGKRLVVVDDSIVRGNTSAQIVKLLKEAGAAEVHFRVSSAPIKTPCFYGIDTATTGELIAAEHSVDDIAKSIGVDSLGYLSVKGMIEAVDAPNKEFCLGCFNQDYPVAIPEEKNRLKLVFE